MLAVVSEGLSNMVYNMAAWAAGAQGRGVGQRAWGLAGTDERVEYSLLTGRVDFQMAPTILVIFINSVIILKYKFKYTTVTI